MESDDYWTSIKIRVTVQYAFLAFLIIMVWIFVPDFVYKIAIGFFIIIIAIYIDRRTDTEQDFIKPLSNSIEYCSDLKY